MKILSYYNCLVMHDQDRLKLVSDTEKRTMYLTSMSSAEALTTKTISIDNNLIANLGKNGKVIEILHGNRLLSISNNLFPVEPMYLYIQAWKAYNGFVIEALDCFRRNIFNLLI